MLAHVDPVIRQVDAFFAKPLALLQTFRAIAAQPKAATGTNNPVPRQSGALRQLRQGSRCPTGCARHAGQSCQLAVTDDTA